MTFHKSEHDLCKLARVHLPDAPPFVELIDAWEAAGPFGEAPFHDEAKLPRLSAAFAAVLGDRAIDAAGLVFAACMVGMIALSKPASSGRSAALRNWFGALAKSDPLFLYGALHYQWRDRWDFSIDDAPVELATDDVHRLVNAAGARYCWRLAQRYWEGSDSVRCGFPALTNCRLPVESPA
jgi:hypothetical protein